MKKGEYGIFKLFNISYKILMKMDISKKDKAAVLKALYDFSKPVGLGILSYQTDKMDIKTVRIMVKRLSFFNTSEVAL